MLIDLSELLSIIDKELDVQADIEMQHFVSRMCDYEIIDKKPFVIKLHNTGKKAFSLETQIELTMLIPCDRCLEDVKYNMNIAINKEIDMNESEDGKTELLEYQNYVNDDNCLDVEKMVYKEILVHLPMKVLCSENCRGICNRCGANLNSQTCDCDTIELDPRMSKIRDIFNNFKEV